MLDAKRKNEIARIVDSLPLADRQRRRVAESVENITVGASADLVNLFRHLQDALPTALAAVDEILKPAPTEPVRRHRMRRGQRLREPEKFVKNAVEGRRHGKKIPAFCPGDLVRVNVKITEDTCERIKTYEGVVIARKNAGVASSFTIREIKGEEHMFRLHSPCLDGIELVRKGRAPRAKSPALRAKLIFRQQAARRIQTVALTV